MSSWLPMSPALRPEVAVRGLLMAQGGSRLAANGHQVVTGSRLLGLNSQLARERAHQLPVGGTELRVLPRQLSARRSRVDQRAGLLLGADQHRWQVRADRQGPERVGPGGIEPTAQPTGARVPGQLGGLPDVRGLEVAEVGVGVLDTADDGDLALLPEGLQRGERRVEAVLVGPVAAEVEHLLGRDGQFAPPVVIGPAVVRDDRVEPVVTTCTG